jgi:hypothetical protein
VKRILIVNADDCNLTEGVTDAILECHEEGIVSSTTWLANLPFSDEWVSAIRRRKGLGLGIHLNVTLGRPVSLAKQVKSLLDREGNFKKLQKQLERLPREREVFFEYGNQIELFKKIFGRLPTHLDTHHQMHDHPLFFGVLLKVASQYRLPVRRSKLMLSSRPLPSGMKTTDFFFGNFNPSNYWRKEPLTTVLGNLPEGVSEIMCHPGCNTQALRAISSFNSGREQEWKLLRRKGLRGFLKDHSVTLSHFGLCYTVKE